MGMTPTWDLPYPDDDTLISESAPIVQDLAERIDAALSQANAANTYTVPGTLVQTFTTSGTFTPPAGVTLVSVVVIGGGGQGGGAYDPNRQLQGGGGCGAEVKVWGDLSVTGPVVVTVGGSGTASSFGPNTARPGAAVSPPNFYGVSLMPEHHGNGGLINITQPVEGVTVNGVLYVGGGGSNTGIGSGDASGIAPLPGAAGGGGAGCTWTGTSWESNVPARGVNATPGAPGSGGGGGGGATGGNGFKPGGLGGSGRVMIYTEQTFSGTAPDPITPTIYAALDAAGVVIGLYALDGADPKLPGVTFDALQVYPSDPQPTGETFKDENGNDQPVLAWPEAGWTFDTVNGWAPPT